MKRKLKISEEMLRNPIVKHNKPIRRTIYILQLLGIFIPIFLPLWAMMIYEVILFVTYEYLDGLFKEFVGISIIELVKAFKILNKRL